MANRTQHRPAVTLLEMLLAIALASMVLYLISIGVDMNLRSLEQHQVAVEEAQLGRVLVRQIARDIRNVVWSEDDGGGYLAAGSSSSGGEAGGTGGSGASGASGIGSGSGAASDSSGTSQGGASAGGASGTGAGSASSLPDDPRGLPRKIGGLLGTRDFLQLDVSQLPRRDEYAGMTATDVAGPIIGPSDVKTVTYFVEPPDSADDTADAYGGLYRRQVDRHLMLEAMQRGDTSLVEALTERIAPEVYRLEFRYFDGFRWWDYWNSEAWGELPRAIEVSLYVASDPAQRAQAARSDGPDARDSEQLDQRYQMLVALPVAIHAPLSSMDSTSGTSGGGR